MSDKDVNKKNGIGSSDPTGADLGRVDPDGERERRALAAERHRQQEHAVNNEGALPALPRPSAIPPATTDCDAREFDLFFSCSAGADDRLNCVLMLGLTYTSSVTHFFHSALYPGAVIFAPLFSKTFAIADISILSRRCGGTWPTWTLQSSGHVRSRSSAFWRRARAASASVHSFAASDHNFACCTSWRTASITKQFQLYS